MVAAQQFLCAQCGFDGLLLYLSEQKGHIRGHVYCQRCGNTQTWENVGILAKEEPNDDNGN